MNIAIITGASSGLGTEYYKAIQGEELDEVWVIARRLERLEELKDVIPFPIKPIPLDLSDKASFKTYATLLSIEKPNITLLINCSGYGKFSATTETSVEGNLNMMDLNCGAVLAMCQHSIPYMERGAKIINIASMLSYQGGIRVPAYTASKSAVMGVTKSMANEWAKYSINVNAIAPGYMVTNNTEKLRQDPKRYGEILDRIPAGRWGDPSDMGGCVVFLASDASTYVHGVTIPVDGGWQAR